MRNWLLEISLFFGSLNFVAFALLGCNAVLVMKLRPVLRQDTRWSSTFTILHRYFQLLPFITDERDLEDFVPRPSQNRRLRTLLDELKNVEFVSNILQATRVSMADVLLFFDSLISTRASFERYFGEF